MTWVRRAEEESLSLPWEQDAELREAEHLLPLFSPSVDFRPPWTFSLKLHERAFVPHPHLCWINVGTLGCNWALRVEIYKWD